MDKQKYPDWLSKGGKAKTEAKAKAARENGKLGGRPRKNAIRYHVDLKEKIDQFNGSMFRGVITGDGTWRGIVNYDGDDREFFESLMEEDENVISYSAEERD